MRRIYLSLVALLGFHLFLLFNLRFTAWPEMFSYPYLLNNGFTLYRDFIYPYPPLLTVVLSYLYTLFGFKLEVLKLTTWLIIIVNDILIFLIVKKLTRKSLFAFLSLLFYILIQPALEGNMLWFDTAIVAPILIATYFLFLNHEDKYFFFSGIALSIAIMIKQTAGLFLIAAFIYLLISKTKIKQLLWFLAGPILAGTLLLTELVKNNVLGDFANWAFVYPFTFWSKFPGYVQMSFNGSQLITVFLLIIPLVVLFVKNWPKTLKDKSFILLTVFLLMAAVGVYPRFSFFHFQPALAFIIILSSYLVDKVKVPTIISASYFLVLVILVATPAFASNWNKEARFYGKNDLTMAQAISEISPSNKRIFLLGQNSNLYVLANRLPPKPWTDNFGWYLEIPGAQQEIISRWDTDKPKYVFWSEPLQGNWFDLGVYQPKEITDWIKENYTKTKEVEAGVWLWKEK